jgi:hypothetical protein
MARYLRLNSPGGLYYLIGSMQDSEKNHQRPPKCENTNWKCWGDGPNAPSASPYVFFFLPTTQKQKAKRLIHEGGSRMLIEQNGHVVRKEIGNGPLGAGLMPI